MKFISIYDYNLFKADCRNAGNIIIVKSVVALIRFIYVGKFILFLAIYF